MSVILGDEMGLGKTIQTAVFLQQAREAGLATGARRQLAVCWGGPLESPHVAEPGSKLTTFGWLLFVQPSPSCRILRRPSAVSSQRPRPPTWPTCLHAVLDTPHPSRSAPPQAPLHK
jgi:hypothetical protein